MGAWGARGGTVRRSPSATEEAVDGLDGRMPLYDAAKGFLRKIFPDHWSFLLGELALYCFVVLVLTGVFLTFFFQPSVREVVYSGPYLPLRGVRMTEAYSSTLRISFEVRGGLLIRQIHHWAALVFTAAISVHLLRIFLTGAFRRPREVNYLVGVTLFQLALLEGFAGYSLPDDLLSGTGLRTAQGFVLSIPLVGSYLSYFLFGGDFPGTAIIPRLFSVHILLLPGALLALIGLHVTLVFKLGHTQWAGPGRTNRNVVGHPMLPHFITKTTGLLLMVFGVLGVASALGQVNPIWRYGPYRPDQVSTDAQPDWYMGFLEGALRLMPGTETRLWGHTISWNPLLPAVVFPGVFFTVLYAYPFLERWVTGNGGEQHLCDRPRNRPTRTGLAVAGAVFYVVLLLAGGQDVIARWLDVSVNGLDVAMRYILVLGPLVAFWVTKRLCLGLQAHDRERLVAGEPTGFVRETVEGAFVSSRRPLPRGRRYTLTVRNVPRPLPSPGPDATRLARLRWALSSWFYRDRVELPEPEPEREQAAAEEPAPKA